MGRKGGDHGDRRSVIPVYSREDIREQYCINDKELAVLDAKRKKGLLGCFSDNGQAGISPCSRHGKKSILTSCIGKTGSDEDLSGEAVKRPVSPGRNGTTWTGNGKAGHNKDEEDGFDENYFRRRPKSFYFDQRRGMCGDQGLRMSHANIAEENYFRSVGYGQHPGYSQPQRPPGHAHCPPHPGVMGAGNGGYQGYPLYSPALTRPEMFLSQDTLPSLTSQLTTQPNTPDLLLHRKTQVR